MAAYGIDRARLALADPTLDVVGDRVIVLHPPYAAERCTLLSWVAHAMPCRAVCRA